MTFLYDIGRVLLDFDFEASLDRLVGPEAQDRAERLARVMTRKDEFESGAIDPDTFIVWALETLASACSADEFRHAWRHIFTPNEPMWHRVRRLAADGHRLILFSNINGIHCPWIFETYPDFSLFHGAVLSYETGSIKPQPDIYRHAIDKYALDPGRTRYIDDLAPNIATGREFGFRCWTYDLNDHRAFENWLADELAEG